MRVSFAIFLIVSWSRTGWIANAEDPCFQNNEFIAGIHWSLVCELVAGAVFPGVSCDVLGPLCPISCNLCDTLYGPASCTPEEVRENKEAAAKVLRSLRVCSNCSAPPDDEETIYNYRAPGAFVQIPWGGYSTMHPADPCGLPGMGCDRCGAMRELNVGYPSPVSAPGAVVTEEIFELRHLSILVVQRTNSVEAHAPHIPGEMWALRMPQLEALLLWSTGFGGLPHLGHMPNMLISRLQENRFSGPLNSVVGSPKARYIDVQQHPLLGYRWAEVAPLTDRVCNMERIVNLVLPYGSMSGTVPDCLQNFQLMEYFWLSGNGLSGDASPLFHSPVLRSAWIEDNFFNGTLNVASTACAFQRVHVERNRLTGTVPDFSCASDMGELDISSNAFTDALAMGGRDLRLTAHSNAFKSFPRAWFNLSSVLQLDLSNNQISYWPPAGVYPRGTFTVDGAYVCFVPYIDTPFAWDSMKSVTIKNNPLHGQDVREVLGSLAGPLNIEDLDVSGCGLTSNLPREGTTFALLPQTDLAACGESLRSGFPSLRSLTMSDNNITSIDGRPWFNLRQADLSRNALAHIDVEWLQTNLIVLDLKSNPDLLLHVLPPSPTGDCIRGTGAVLQANPRGFSASLGLDASSECTELCIDGRLLYLDGTANTTSMCRCRAGWYGDAGSCLEAGEDEWSGEGAKLPTPCPEHSFTVDNSVGLGKRSSQDACKCQAGYYTTYDANLTLVCAPCPANTVSTQPGAPSREACVHCSLGTFSEEASSRCLQCPDDMVADETLGVGCKFCEPGQYLQGTGAARTCVRCPFGQYQPHQGQRSCIPCEGEGNHTWELERNPDTGRFTELLGAVSASNCGCAPGHRQVGDRCVACGVGESEGLSCPGGLSDDVVSVLHGYFSEWPLSVYQCITDKDRCPGGLPAVQKVCALGRTGLTCALCEGQKIPASRGECEDCAGAAEWMLPIASVVVVSLAVILYLSIDKFNGTMQSRAVMLATGIFSIIVTVMQQAGAISLLAIDWVRPFNGVLRALSLVTFDLDVVNIGCIAKLEPMADFTTKVLVLLAGVIVISLVHLVVVALRHNMQFRSRLPTLIVSVGTVTTMFLLSVVTTVTGPLQCQSHPNQAWTVRSYPSVVCWDSDTHDAMVAIAAVALVAVLGYVVGIVYVVSQYIHRVNKGDMEFLASFNFLFFRFHPQCYWYVLVQTIRSLLFALTTIIPEPMMTILAMQLVTLVSALLIIRVLPWRAAATNYLDLAGSVSILMILSMSIAMAPQLQRHEKESVAWVSAITLMVCLIVPPIVLLVVVIKRLMFKKKRYAYFLCHHKAGAGAFTRLLKITLRSTMPMKRAPSTSTRELFQGGGASTSRVFLDSDDLDNLDHLFSYVQEDTGVVVAIASRELLLRPWCAGELTTARVHSVKVIPVHMSDYVAPTADFIASYTSEVDISALIERAISQVMVEETLSWFAGLHAVSMCAALSERAMDDLSQILTQQHMLSETTSINEASCSVTAGAQIAVVVDTSNMEGMASALVLEKLLAPMLGQEHGLKMQVFADPSMSFDTTIAAGLFVLTGGCLDSKAFLVWVCMAASNKLTPIPVVAQESFRFPSRDEVMKLPVDEDPSFIAAYVMEMFKSIATTFLAQYAGETVLLLACKQIRNRLLMKKKGPMQSSEDISRLATVGTEGSSRVNRHGTVSTQDSDGGATVRPAPSDKSGGDNVALAAVLPSAYVSLEI